MLRPPHICTIPVLIFPQSKMPNPPEITSTPLTIKAVVKSLNLGPKVIIQVKKVPIKVQGWVTINLVYKSCRPALNSRMKSNMKLLTTRSKHSGLKKALRVLFPISNTVQPGVMCQNVAHSSATPLSCFEATHRWQAEVRVQSRVKVEKS